MATDEQQQASFAGGNEDLASITLDNVSFLHKFVGNITCTLEEVVGINEASGFMNTVAQRMGEQLNDMYRHSLNSHKLNREQVCHVIADLQNRINSNAQITHKDEEKIIIGGCICPAGADNQDRPSLCSIITNMLGVISAENLGYSKVVVKRPDTNGNLHCQIVIHLNKTPEVIEYEGREHFQS